MRETLQRSQTQQTPWAASSQSFGNSSSGFSAVLIRPKHVGTTHRAGAVSLVNILVWGSHPSPKKAWDVSCYSLKASDNIWCSTTWALHSHPHPLALLSPDGNTQAHRYSCARSLLQPGPSAPMLLTAKPRAMSGLGMRKQVERNRPLLQIHQPEAELASITDPQPASATHLISMAQQHEEPHCSHVAPPERDAFQKEPSSIGFLHLSPQKQHLSYLRGYTTIVAFLHWPELICLLSVPTFLSLNRSLSCRRKAPVSFRYENQRKTDYIHLWALT